MASIFLPPDEDGPCTGPLVDTITSSSSSLTTAALLSPLSPISPLSPLSPLSHSSLSSTSSNSLLLCLSSTTSSARLLFPSALILLSSLLAPLSPLTIKYTHLNTKQTKWNKSATKNTAPPKPICAHHLTTSILPMLPNLPQNVFSLLGDNVSMDFGHLKGALEHRLLVALLALALVFAARAYGGGVLHLEYGVLAKVDKLFQLFLVIALVHNVIQKLSLGLLNLRLVPLLNIGLFYLEVDAFYAAGRAGYFDAAQERLEIAQKTGRLFHQALKSRLVAHVLTQVGQQHGHVEPNVLGRIVKSLRELIEINFSILIGVHTHQNVVDFFARVHFLGFHGAPKLLWRNPSIAIGVKLLEGLAGRQVLHFQKNVKKFQQHLDIWLIFDQRVHHLFANGPIEHVSLEHAQQHDDHVLLQLHELSEQLDLQRVLAQLVLQIGEYVEEAANGVPEAAVRQSQLIAHARPLYVLGERVEHLFGDVDGAAKVVLAGRVHRALARVVPVEVHERLLQPQQVVHGADDYVHCGVVAGLGAQIILKLQIVAFAQQLQKSEQGAGKIGIVQIFFARHARLAVRGGQAAELLGLDAPLERVQVEHAAVCHEAGQRGKKAHVLFVPEVLEHALLDVHVAAVQQRYAQLERLFQHLGLFAARRRNVQQTHLGGAALCQPVLRSTGRRHLPPAPHAPPPPHPHRPQSHNSCSSCPQTSGTTGRRPDWLSRARPSAEWSRPG
ncbi:hypothetical protein BpHYR1_032513 [Brachionus plicatilis]|uniref:Uncharacterized protein n=1 Tax=Brachionus plicatilis TaxID=10195 RepID=A0A3M7Q5M0_BRAPC|nr:hypothetical protein BpHYR1_032513 [Brachionus plicatilis]